MTWCWPTKLRPFVLSGLLLLFLANCQPTGSRPVEAAAPPPPPPEVPVEALKSLCLAWFNSLPTWEDADAEATKNGIDFSYRTQEEVCKRYFKEGSLT